MTANHLRDRDLSTDVSRPDMVGEVVVNRFQMNSSGIELMQS